MNQKANVTCSHFSELSCAQSRPFIREFGVSLCHWWLSRGRQSENNHSCSEKDLKKNIVHPFCYLFRKQERERHMKQWTELCELGSSPEMTEFLVDFRSYVRRKRRMKCPVCPTILSIYNQHVWTESTVQLPPHWASWWHWQVCLWAHSCVYELVEDVVCVGVCDIERIPTHCHWTYSYTSQGRWIHEHTCQWHRTERAYLYTCVLFVTI